MPLRIDVGNNDRIMRQGEIHMEFVISHLVKNYGSKQVLKDVDFVSKRAGYMAFLDATAQAKRHFLTA